MEQLQLLLTEIEEQHEVSPLITYMHKLRGDLNEGDKAIINGLFCEVLKSFNTYKAYPIVKQIAKDQKVFFNKSIDYPYFLEKMGLVKVLQQELYRDVVDESILFYGQFPFSADIREILKSCVIISIEFTKEEILQLSPWEVVIHSKMRSLINTKSYNPNLSHFQNLKHIIAELNKDYSANPIAYE